MENITLGTILHELRCMDDRASVMAPEQLDIINASLIVCIGIRKAPTTNVYILSIVLGRHKFHKKETTLCRLLWGVSETDLQIWNSTQQNKPSAQVKKTARTITKEVLLTWVQVAKTA
jgi:hypothetical protein